MITADIIKELKTVRTTTDTTGEQVPSKAE